MKYTAKMRFLVLLLCLRVLPSFPRGSDLLQAKFETAESNASAGVFVAGYEDELTDDQKVFISTIAGEATITAAGYRVSPLARQAIANVIMNRIGQREWAKYTTATEICAYTGFGGYRSYLYEDCMDYLNHRDGSNEEIETLIKQVLPVYEGTVSDITGGAQLFYTPAAMPRGEGGPRWDNSKLKEILISGIDPYYEGRFYRYK